MRTETRDSVGRMEFFANAPMMEWGEGSWKSGSQAAACDPISAGTAIGHVTHRRFDWDGVNVSAMVKLNLHRPYGYSARTAAAGSPDPRNRRGCTARPRRADERVERIAHAGPSKSLSLRQAIGATGWRYLSTRSSASSNLAYIAPDFAAAIMSSTEARMAGGRCCSLRCRKPWMIRSRAVSSSSPEAIR